VRPGAGDCALAVEISCPVGELGKYVNRFALMLALLGVAAGVGLIAYRELASEFTVQPMPGSATTPDVGGAFTLVDHTGQTVTDQDFRGQYMLVYFGYTYCPDVCPNTLLAVSQALDDLGPLADQVRPILITVDPERDDRAVLADYVGHFHPRLVGLTGSPERIAEAAKAYRVYYAKAQVPEQQGGDAGDDYLMDHSGFLYLMDREGRLGTLMSHGSGPDEIAAKIRELLDQG
jgi:protein SCO1/2